MHKPTEISTAKTFLQEEEPQLKKSLHSVYYHLLKVPVFSNQHTVLSDSYDAWCEQCQCRKEFSSLRRLKTYLRSTMTQECLTNLALLYIERDLSSQLWDKLDELVIAFAKTAGLFCFRCG